MRRSVERTRFRSAANLRHLDSPLSQVAQPPWADLLRWPRRIAHEESLLHLGDDVAGDFKSGRDPVAAIGVQPDNRFGDHRGGVELVGNRDPVLAAKTAFREPATDFAPPGRLVGALALDAPPKPGSTVPLGIVVDADDP